MREEAVFQLSRCCLESARDVIGTLEREYRALYGRNLTLGRLAEAVILPLCPDKGTCLGYDPNLAASVYLENDLEQLLRTHPGADLRRLLEMICGKPLRGVILCSIIMKRLESSWPLSGGTSPISRRSPPRGLRSAIWWRGTRCWAGAPSR